ncbi:hypothetical protein [Corynebacterium glutamicum]|uniref:hypothetical protein n=1 Tax=Corynebacterium glutamicum TaxID=1718 RepID=UPI0002E8D78E|nr:hypothetical protein [Corynebacterium glutamicum]
MTLHIQAATTITGMEWTELVSQSIPALAAVLGGAVTGGIQFVNRKSERNQEKELKKEELNHAKNEAAQERIHAHVEQQKQAVRQFLLTLRDQQNRLIEVREYIREQKEDKDLVGVDGEKFEYMYSYETACICRQKVIQAWDQLELVATDDLLKRASSAVGNALNDKQVYDDCDIFPGVRSSSKHPPKTFENLVADLRSATSNLHTRLN